MSRDPFLSFEEQTNCSLGVPQELRRQKKEDDVSRRAEQLSWMNRPESETAIAALRCKSANFMTRGQLK